MKKLATTLLILLLSLPAWGQGDLAAGTAWSQIFFARIDTTYSGGDFHARWDVSRSEHGDMHIRAEETLPGEIRTGEQLLLNGNALLVKGFENHQGDLSALLDSPVLMMQLLFVMLQKAGPAGPSALSETLEPEILEPQVPLLLDSGVATGQFPAPWSLKGTIRPAPRGRVIYELNFEFELRDAELNIQKQEILFSGYLDYLAQKFPVDESTLMDGWTLEWLNNDENHPELEPDMTLGQFKEMWEMWGQSQVPE